MQSGDAQVHQAEAVALLRRSRGIAQRARLQLMLSEEAARRVREFVEQHGMDKLLTALDHGPLYDPNLAASSKLAVQHAADHVQADLPCALVIKFDPRNKNEQRRTDVRLLTGGTVNLQLDLGRAAGD